MKRTTTRRSSRWVGECIIESRLINELTLFLLAASGA